MTQTKIRPFWYLTPLCGVLLVSTGIGQNTSQAQPPSAKAKQELLELENHWLQVENDPDALASILAPDFLHVVPVGIITKDEQLMFMREHPAPHGKQEKHFENLHARVYGTAGIVNGVVVATESGVTHRTLFTDVFAYRNGRWQAVNAQELPEGNTSH